MPIRQSGWKEFPVLLWVSVRSPKLDAASQTLQKDGFHRQRSRSRSRIRKRSRKSAYDLLKIKHRSRKRSHKREGIRVRRIRTFLFLPTPLTTPSLMFRLWSRENQIVGVGGRSGRMKQSQSLFPRLVFGLSFRFCFRLRQLVFTRL